MSDNSLSMVRTDLAVLTRRFDDLEREFQREIEARRREQEQEEAERRHDDNELEEKIDAVADQIKTARGGLIVLMSLGGLAASIWTDLLSKVAKLWSH